MGAPQTSHAVARSGNEPTPAKVPESFRDLGKQGLADLSEKITKLSQRAKKVLGPIIKEATFTSVGATLSAKNKLAKGLGKLQARAQSVIQGIREKAKERQTAKAEQAVSKEVKSVLTKLKAAELPVRDKIKLVKAFGIEVRGLKDAIEEAKRDGVPAKGLRTSVANRLKVAGGALDEALAKKVEAYERSVQARKADVLAAFARRLASDGGMTEQQIKQHITGIHASVDQGVRGMMLSIPNQRQMEEAHAILKLATLRKAEQLIPKPVSQVSDDRLESLVLAAAAMRQAA